jgi:L-histidine N-alpha-methyltransferase
MSRVETYLTDADRAAQLREDVARGLSAQPKWLPPKWFYDERGSELFDEITRLPEYYPSRAERSVLREHAAEIAVLTGAKTLVELGSGTSEKTRLLLNALSAHGTLARFVPFDVSESTLREAAEAISADYPDIEVYAIVGDFTTHLGYIPPGDARLVAFLGSTIGNLPPREREVFFGELRSTLDTNEWFLLGADLVKDEATLVAAYDDAAGVTAEFNRNVLRVLNRELGADFDVDGFDHVAVWDARNEWMQMGLRATRPMTVHVLDLTVSFAAGEQLRTEISAKFRREGLDRELHRAGFTLHRWWTDPENRFAVALARAD